MKQWMAGEATAVLVGVLTWWPNIWVRSHAAPDLAFRKEVNARDVRTRQVREHS